MESQCFILKTPTAKHIQPAIKDKPPIGVIAPNEVLPVAIKRNREPENNRMPIKNR